MATPILATKLYIPPPRSHVVLRFRLIERLDEGLHRRLTLISAPAGFGKTTLVSEWIAGCARREPKVRVAWLSLDEADNDLIRFLTGLIAALQTIAPNIGEGVLNALQSTPPPSTEFILMTLLNEITCVPDHFILTLDDYHVIDAKLIDHALTFLIEHQPPQMHLVIATREDPHLPLAQLRVRDQLTELRAADLRFAPGEAAEFLNQVMRLNLCADDIAALETRTEGWIAGLQLAAISMQGHEDTASFIQSFSGSHRFVMDYLVEQVLQQQSESIQNFLLRTSILDRMCGALCDAVLGEDKGEEMKDEKGTLSTSSSFTRSVHPSSFILESLERANLFIVPLDNERCWYRYHHLFAELLRKRLGTSLAPERITELHIRVSEWYENNDLMLEAFHHAAAANDVERAVRLMESKRMPLYLSGTMTAIQNWLESLPTPVLNARPALWLKQAELLLLSGQTANAEEKLRATESALAAGTLPSTEADDQTGDLIGKIAAIRSNLAIAQQRAETILVQARRALEYLRPNNLSFRSSVTRDMGFAYYLLGDRAAAGRTFAEALSIAQASGDMVEPLLATIGLAEIQSLENQLYLAAENYRRILPQIEDYSLLNAGVVYLGLAMIYYEWNDLETAEKYGEQSLQLARQYNQIVNRFIMSAVFLARLKLAQGDVDGAAALLTQAEQAAHQHNFMRRMPEIVAAQVITLLRQGDLATAAELAQQYELPMSRARVLLAQGNPSAALAVLEPYRQQMEAKNWQNERLKAMVLQALAHHANNEKDKSLQVLSDTLASAEPGGFVRLFVDEGEPMKFLISDLRFKTEPRLAQYAQKLLSAFPVAHLINSKLEIRNHKSEIPIEPLSPRELEVLRLIAQGFSNQEICERLVLALSTVKGHNREIFGKLQVQSRTEAIARARELDLL